MIEDQTEIGQCELQLLFAGSRCLAVPVAEVDALVDWRTPTPLPGAPQSVLGVVSIRGRMLTVIDLTVLLGENELPREPKQIVALRGAEQLALAVDRAGDSIAIDGELVVSMGRVGSLTVSVVTSGADQVEVLNTSELFAAAIRGRERRRRRF